MNPALPPLLKNRIEELLEGVSRKDLAAKSAAISHAYRSGGTSAGIKSKAEALAYILSRLPAIYAVALAAFAAVKEAAPDLAPQTLLDAGAGPGTASWAAVQVWPELRRIAMVDSNPAFLAAARTLAHASDNDVLCGAELRAYDLATATEELHANDLVTASFVLAELADSNLTDVVGRLWNAAKKALVLIEPGTPSGFARIRSARAWLIAHGAHVLAPCTHEQACPIIDPDWCHFSQRLPRSRDHLKVKGASVPFEDERYSYVAVSRSEPVRANMARIIAPPEETKSGLTLPLCAERGLQRAFISRRQRDVFALLRKAKWGDTILSED